MSKPPKETSEETKKRNPTVRRIIRWTWFPLTCAAALVIGLTIGYVYIGKQSLHDVFDVNTWRHIFDLIFSDS